MHPLLAALDRCTAGPTARIAVARIAAGLGCHRSSVHRWADPTRGFKGHYLPLFKAEDGSSYATARDLQAFVLAVAPDRAAGLPEDPVEFTKAMLGETGPQGRPPVEEGGSDG